MKNKITHFAIHTDDMKRAKNFYSEVFEWNFNSYGADDFFQIKVEKSEGADVIGALQSRKYSPVKEKIIGLECSIEVEDIGSIILKVQKAGGQILMPKTSIPGVGWVAKFLDTEGNLICGIQYDISQK